MVMQRSMNTVPMRLQRRRSRMDLFLQGEQGFRTQPCVRPQGPDTPFRLTIQFNVCNRRKGRQTALMAAGRTAHTPNQTDSGHRVRQTVRRPIIWLVCQGLYCVDSKDKSRCVVCTHASKTQGKGYSTCACAAVKPAARYCRGSHHKPQPWQRPKVFWAHW